MPAGEFSIEHYADVIKEFCGKLGIDKVTLIGNSMGGQVGTIVAKKTPEMLRKADPRGPCRLLHFTRASAQNHSVRQVLRLALQARRRCCAS